MVTTVTSSDSRNRANPGEGYDGVVRITHNGSTGTGALLYGGRAVLTAGHLFADTTTETIIIFETASGEHRITASQVEVLPTYDRANENGDLALVWLSENAPVDAERYQLYRDGDEIGQTMTMVGYGLIGTGTSGTQTNTTGNYLRQKAENQFDIDAATLKSTLGATMAWTPLIGTQLMADFDDGSSAHDAFGQLINRSGTGLGQNEGMIAPGDSGGPAFIGNQVAGIASLTASLSFNSHQPDIDDTGNSSYGEIGDWQRAGHFQQWIDQSLREQYPDAPIAPNEVQTSVSEGNSGTTFAYFLLQFHGTRSNSAELLSVDYATRDGSATAGQDYLATEGKLILYPGDNQTVIPVEIIGDRISEPDETFYLDVFNPVGGNFENNAITLTAVRTIVNDDGF